MHQINEPTRQTKRESAEAAEQLTVRRTLDRIHGDLQTADRQHLARAKEAKDAELTGRLNPNGLPAANQ